MEGLPVKLMVNPDTTPIAHHTRVGVPFHWQDKVKVPIGKSVTWCDRMSVCAKKNDKP